jgi:hypothetical protein
VSTVALYTVVPWLLDHTLVNEADVRHLAIVVLMVTYWYRTWIRAFADLPKSPALSRHSDLVTMLQHDLDLLNKFARLGAFKAICVNCLHC